MNSKRNQTSDLNINSKLFKQKRKFQKGVLMELPVSDLINVLIFFAFLLIFRNVPSIKKPVKYFLLQYSNK